ncbi:MAG: carboxypeptidase-like regulatory domain-containing protein [Bacteroidia bacterium]
MNTKSFLLNLLILIGALSTLSAQTQTIRGTVYDAESEIPLTGATILITDLTEAIGAYSDDNGRFVLKNVPVGRRTLNIKYLGYKEQTLPNILVTSGKEVIMEVRLVETVTQTDEVVISARTKKDLTINEMSTVSARTFSLEEVTRYSGARNDVARMAGNFAGVATADDSRNDIVIRGNSPTGVLWRLEGIPIPNPNHFSTLGTTGGPVSALNPNLLKNSDFLTGAFSAEYGNALAGVFDVGLRSGNKEKGEYTAQLAAFSGFELMAEGPINTKKSASYLASARYSFVQIADYLGIPIGTNATPNYRDLSVKLDFGRGKLGSLEFFGIGATSNIDFLSDEIDGTDLFADPNSDAYVKSGFGVGGLKHNILLGKKSYLRTVASVSTSQNTYIQDNYLDNPERTKFEAINSKNVSTLYSVSSFINKKYSARFTARAGVVAEMYQLNLDNRDRDGRPDLDGDGFPDWVSIFDFQGNTALYQAYVQTKYKLSDKLTLNFGLHSQMLALNDDFALEPRAAINWEFGKGNRLSFAYGLHQQMQPLPIYFFTEQVDAGVFARTNENLDFTRSQHFVLAYDLSLGSAWRIKAEAYYQAIDKAPVDQFSSSFSVLNAGADFVFPDRGSLVNNGEGRNYGLEVTVEKFFQQGWYGLFTGSLFDASYIGSDGIRRSSAFNNQYVGNFLFGKEFKVGKNKRNAFTFDMKVTTAGGRFYTPVDLAASQAAGQEVRDETLAFSERFDPYFRLDTKFGFRLNGTKKVSHQFFIDFQNLTANDNIFTRRYNEVTNEINNVYQSGFFPDILYRIQF